MSPDSLRLSTSVSSVPRASGDEPEKKFVATYSPECSPRERG